MTNNHRAIRDASYLVCFNKDEKMIKKYGIYLLMIVLLVTASFMIYKKLTPKKLSSNLIASSGKIDGDLIVLNTKYPGRVVKIIVQDGQAIKQGDTIAQLQSDEYRAKLNGIKESVKAARHGVRAMQEELELAKQSVLINIKKSKKAITLAILQKQELQNSINTLQALAKQNKKDYERAKTLYNQKLIATQKLEYARLTLTTSKDKLSSMQTKRLQANNAIEISQNNYNLAIAQNKKITALKSNIAASQNKIKALQANADEVQIVINKLTIKSPIDGYVIEKIAQSGEVLGSGMVVCTLIDPQTLYLKVFIDTINNGKLKVGDKADIFLDAYPNKAIKAKIVSIAANAEFTPKEVAVRSDRIQRVYAVHVKPLHVNPLLKLGIPAIGIISLDGKDLPSSLNDIPVI